MVSKKKPNFKANTGFTLIELLVVVAIISILAALIILRITSASKDARNTKRKDDVAKIKNALDIFVAQGGTIQCIAPGCTGTPWYSLRQSNMADLESRLIFVKGSAQKLPNEYLPNNEFPIDPKGTFAEQYYILTLDSANPKHYSIFSSNAEDEGILKDY